MLGTPSSMIYGRVLAPPPCTCGRRLRHHVVGPRPTTFTPKPATTSPAEPAVISTMPNVPVFQQPTAPPPIQVAVPLQIPAPAPPPPPAAHGYCDDPEHAKTELCMNPVSATGHDAQTTKSGGAMPLSTRARLRVDGIIPGSRILVDGSDFSDSNGAWEGTAYSVEVPRQGKYDVAVAQPDGRRLRGHVESRGRSVIDVVVAQLPGESHTNLHDFGRGSWGEVGSVPDYGFVPAPRRDPKADDRVSLIAGPKTGPDARAAKGGQKVHSDAAHGLSARGTLYGQSSMSGGSIPRPYSGPYDLRQWERGAAGVGRMNDMMIGSRPSGDQPMPWRGPVNVRGWSGPGRGIDAINAAFRTLPGGEQADITARMAGVPQSAEGDAVFADLVDAAGQRAGAFQRCVAMYSAMPLADQTQITSAMAAAGLPAGSPEYARLFCQLVYATPSARPVSTRSSGTVGDLDFMTPAARPPASSTGAACDTQEYQDCVQNGGLSCARLCGDAVQGGDGKQPSAREESALDYISSVGDIGLRGLGQFLDHDLRGRALDLQEERLRLDDAFRRAQLEAGRGNADAANEAADIQRQIRDNESRGRELAAEAHSQGTSRQQQGIPTWAVAAAVALALAATGYAVMQARR